VSTIVDIIQKFYGTLGMAENYQVSLSVRGDDGKMYLGSDEVRAQAESALETAAKEKNLPFERIPGEAAFYGPKLDFVFRDALGRPRQLATIQCDFNLPERFDLHFINESNSRERPVVIHRAISGSLERFMGLMIEHFAGAFPARLAPTQAIFLPVSTTFFDQTREISQQFSAKNIRISVDSSDDSLAKKIRNAESLKIPYILVVGEKELAENTLSVREFRSKKQYSLPTADFLAQLTSEVQTRALEPQS